MEELVTTPFAGKTVFLTGHTGFKGSWLAFWLLQQGATVAGYSLPVRDNQNLFSSLEIQKDIQHFEGDVRDVKRLGEAVIQAQPDFVFHLAAQALVLDSYDHPRETFEVNVQGTVNLLDSIRKLQRRCITVVVTSDKCYENREWGFAYRENDAMGGHDPYSASKGCAELVTASFRRSFFSLDGPHRLASARAGNVIGGGDTATNRIVPDCLRAIANDEVISVRNRFATRPWQHVLEPLSGYLKLAQCVQEADDAGDDTRLTKLCDGFNFGPAPESNRSVSDLVEELVGCLGGAWTAASTDGAPHEAGRLHLAIDKARHILDWKPTWDFKEAVFRVAEWFQRTRSGESASDVMRHQISQFDQTARLRDANQ